MLDAIYYILMTCSSLYFGAWLFFCKPIITACELFDQGTLTGVDIIWTLIQCTIICPIVIFLCILIVCFVWVAIDFCKEKIGEIRTGIKDRR